MCGIAGLLWTKPTNDAASVGDAAVRAMTDALAHRGPDGEGFHRQLVDDRAVCHFGHRRLAIVDEAGGAQPFVEGDLVLIANCEIYGHEELRAQLQSDGARFRSRCDAEVILHGYRRWGTDVVKRLDGMFAFALWDATNRRLLLARDRLGQKPLYWCNDDDRFTFASEATSLVRGRSTRPSICPDALARYLLLDFVPTPRSIFAGVSALPAATFMVVDSQGRTTSTRYFDPADAAADRAPVAPTRDSIIEQLPALFDDALARRRMSDRPVGLFLSGGLDSSIVAHGLARLATADTPLHSYSVRFSNAGYDESGFAREVAALYGTEHTEVDLAGAEVPQLAADVIGGLDEPLADASTMAVWALSRRAREDVKVVLGGDGADELFGGYDVFTAARIDAATSILGSARPRILRTLAAIVGGGEDHFSFDFQLRQAARGLDTDERARALAYTFNDDPDRVLHRMAHPPTGSDLTDDARVNDRAANGIIDLTFRAYQGLFLESNILRKIDRAGMAHGLEIRSPFLDHRLVELVATLPPHERLYGRASKPLLRDALGTRAPKSVSGRRKHGFIVPIARWINSDLRNWFDGIVNERLPDDLIDRNAAKELLREHREGRVNQRKPLWNLAALTLWHEGVRDCL